MEKMDLERSTFEEWAAEAGLRNFTKRDDGTYTNGDVQSRWDVWQAAYAKGVEAMW